MASLKASITPSVVASPELIASSHSSNALTFIEDDRLRELNFGAFEGKSRKDLLSSHLSSEYQTWQNGLDPSPDLSVEDWNSAKTRAKSFLDDIYSDSNAILLVSHGYFIRVIIVSCILNIPFSKLKAFRLDCCKFVAISWEADEPRIICFNTNNLDGIFDEAPTS